MVVVDDGDGDGSWGPGDVVEFVAVGGGFGGDGDLDEVVPVEAGAGLMRFGLWGFDCVVGFVLVLGGVDASGEVLDDVVVGEPSEELLSVCGHDGESVASVEDELAKGFGEGFVGEHGLGFVGVCDGSEW